MADPFNLSEEQQALFAKIPGVDEPFQMPEPRVLRVENEKGEVEEPEPPKRDDYFRGELQLGLSNPQFDLLPDEEKLSYIDKIFDSHPDQRFKSLPPQERMKYLDLQVEELKSEHEYQQSIAGQLEGYFGRRIPIIEEPLEVLDKVRGLRTAMSEFFGRGGQTAIGAIEEGLATDIGMVQDTFKQGLVGDKQALVDFVDRVTQGQIPDEQFEKLQTWAEREVKAPDWLKSDLDVVDHMLDNMKSGLRSQAKIQLDSAARVPTATGSDTRLKEIDGPGDVLDWAGSLFGGSMAHLAPALLTRKFAGGKRGLTPYMQPGHAGMIRQYADEKGVELSDTAVAGLGLANAYLDSLFGAEGVIAQGPAREIYKELINSGAKRFITRWAAGSTLEGVTEELQEFITIQAPKWEEGNVAFYANLTPEDKEQLLEAFVGGFALGLPFEATAAYKKGKVERGVGKRLKRLLDLQRTPKERGRAADLTVMTRPSGFTEQMLDEIRYRASEDLDFLSTEQRKAFVKGAPIPGAEEFTEEQQDALGDAHNMAEEITLGKAPVPIEVDDRVAKGMLRSLGETYRRKQDSARRAHQTSRVERIQKARDTMHFVQPQDEAWTQIEEFAREHMGVALLAFDHEGKHLVGGIYNQPGVVLVSAKNRADMAVVSLMMHEATHNLSTANPEAHRQLINYIQENFPDEWAKVGRIVSGSSTYANIGEARVEREKLAFFIEGRDLLLDDDTMEPLPEDNEMAFKRTRDIIKMFQDFDEMSKKADPPRGVRKFLEWIRTTLQQWSEKSEFIANLTKITPGDSDAEVQRKAMAFAKLAVEAFEETAKLTGEVAKRISEAPRTEIPRPGGEFTPPPRSRTVQLKNMQPGDVVVIRDRNHNRPFEVQTIQNNTFPDGREFSVIHGVNNDGAQVDVVMAQTATGYVIRRSEAPESPTIDEEPQTPDTPPEEPEAAPEAPEPEPEPIPEEPEDLFTEEADTDPRLTPKRLTPEELRRIKSSDYYKAAEAAARNNEWDEIDAESYHEALNRNIAAVTLTPYTEEELASDEFRLFKLKGAEIYVALKGVDAVGGINNDLSRLPGLASDAFMVKAIVEGAETADCFNVTLPGSVVGFLAERYMRWGWRFATTDEMPDWAVEAGGRHGVLPFSEEAYLEEHSTADLDLARRYWREQGATTDPDVVFLVWDPPPGTVRDTAKLWEQHDRGEIGTRQVAIDQMFHDTSIQEIQAAIEEAVTFKEVSKQEYMDSQDGSDFGVGKSGTRYWLIYDDIVPEGYEDMGYDPVETRIGRMAIRQRFANTEDNDLYFEWIDTYDSPNQKQIPHPVLGILDVGGLGYRGVVALGRILKNDFDGALYVGGYRAGAAHQIAERTGKGDAHIRRRLYTPKEAERLGIVYPEVDLTDEELGEKYGYDKLEGYDGDDWENGGPTDEELQGAIDEYDDQEVKDLINLSQEIGFEVDAEMQRLLGDIDNSEEESLNYVVPPLFGEAPSMDTMRKWKPKDWNAFGKKHGIKNMGGLRKRVKVGKVEVPGGTKGTWSFQELLWMQSQAWDPNEVWTEEEHIEIQKKLARTMTPEKPDPLQALNAMIFAMISPQTNLTANEISYALRRVRNREQVEYWVSKLPWKPSEGERPGREVYERMSEEQKEWFQVWASDERNIHDLDALKDSEMRKLMKLWVADTVNAENGVIRGAAGGLGLRGGADSAEVLEMMELWLKDPEWFLIRDGESWHIFVQRLASQLNGVSHKVGIFGGVWQDPLNAAVSAIDRHMAVIFRDHILGRGDLRTSFEEKAVSTWRAKRKKSEAANVDDIVLEPGGASFISGLLAEELKKVKTPKYVKEKFPEFGDFIRDPEKLVLFSEAYKRALEANAKVAEQLGLGVFAAQHYKWDRYRARFETHFMMFPGLYKAPLMSKGQLRDHTANMKGIDRGGKGWITSQKEEVEIDGEKVQRLRRPRPAPPGSYPMMAPAEVVAPSAFEKGTGQTLRSSIHAAQASHPSTVLNHNGGPMWLIPPTMWWQRARIKFQDRFLRVFQMQRAVEDFGGRIDDPMDVYLHELLYHGRVSARVELFEDEFIKPLMDKIRSEGISIREFEEWLQARHTAERNDHLTEIWYRRRKGRLNEELQVIADEIDLAEQVEEDFDTTVLMRRYERKQRELRKLERQKAEGKLPIAGMTDAEALQILDDAGDKFDEVAPLFDQMMNQKLQILHEGGLITDEQLKRVSVYNFYVPLKGKEYDGDLEILLEDIGAGTGSGFDIRGDELGTAMGRVGGAMATHPIISQAVVDIEDAIIRVEKNRVGEALLAFVEEFPNADLYEVNQLVGRRVWDSKAKEAKIVKDKFARKAPNVVAVKRDGKTFYVHLKDARLAMAMKNIGSPNHGTVLKLFAAANRLMAKINTTLNPEFMVSNFARDLQTAMVHLSDKDAQGLMTETMASLAPAMRGIAGAEDLPGVERTEWSDVYDEFKAEGGKIGFFGYNDVISKARAIDRSIRRQGFGAHRWTMRQIMAFGSLVERMNTVVENGIRLAAYKTAVDAGMSKARAAALARRLTVNFNKKGDAGSTMNALYLFSNASVQGTARMFQALSRSKRVRWIAASQVMAGAVAAMLSRAMGGDDPDDETPYWEKLPDWQKETNAILMLPGTGGDHIKIPLAYGYNVFWVLGQQIEDVLHKAATGTMKASDIPKMGLTVADSILGAFNPLGATRLDSSWGVFRQVVPSIFSPIADTFVNETYYGAPIEPPRSSWDKSPDSARYFRSVNPLTQKVTQWANEVTGGNTHQPGWADVNPEILDYLIGSYAGAGAKTGKRMLFDGPAWLVRGDWDVSAVEARDVAFLRRIYGEENDYTVASIYYENIEEIEQAENAYSNLTGSERRRWRRKHGWKTQLFDDMATSRKTITKAKTDQQKEKARKRFNRAYRRAWLSQF